MSLVVSAAGATYLLLHAGPLLRLWYGPSIRSGTRWPFFLSEVLLFVAWATFVPAIASSRWGQAAVVVHILTHASYAVADAFAHTWLLDFALARRREAPIRWAIKEGMLLVDTTTHVVAVVLALISLPPAAVVAVLVAAIPAYLVVSSGYLRAQGTT